MANLSTAKARMQVECTNLVHDDAVLSIEPIGGTPSFFLSLKLRVDEYSKTPIPQFQRGDSPYRTLYFVSDDLPSLRRFRLVFEAQGISSDTLPAIAALLSKAHPVNRNGETGQLDSISLPVLNRFDPAIALAQVWGSKIVKQIQSGSGKSTAAQVNELLEKDSVPEDAQNAFIRLWAERADGLRKALFDSTLPPSLRQNFQHWSSSVVNLEETFIRGQDGNISIIGRLIKEELIDLWRVSDELAQAIFLSRPPLDLGPHLGGPELHPEVFERGLSIGRQTAFDAVMEKDCAPKAFAEFVTEFSSGPAFTEADYHALLYVVATQPEAYRIRDLFTAERLGEFYRPFCDLLERFIHLDYVSTPMARAIVRTLMECDSGHYYKTVKSFVDRISNSSLTPAGGLLNAPEVVTEAAYRISPALLPVLKEDVLNVYGPKAGSSESSNPTKLSKLLLAAVFDPTDDRFLPLVSRTLCDSTAFGGEDGKALLKVLRENGGRSLLPTLKAARNH